MTNPTPNPYDNGGSGKKRWWEHWWVDVLVALLIVAGLYLLLHLIVN